MSREFWDGALIAFEALWAYGLLSAIILSALTDNFKPTAISGCGILSFMLKLNSLSALPLNTLCLLLDALRFIKLSLRPRSALAAENLFLRKQLAL
jgi:hypothetical protein